MKYLKSYESIFSPTMEKREKLIRNRYVKSTINMTSQETIDYIFEHCSEWLENPINIKRGLYAKYDYFYSKPVKRYSRDCLNYYTLIMDNTKDWSEYPKRSKSFICAFGNTSEGSDTYYVIPEDGSNWGIAPDDDIYMSFYKSQKPFDFSLSINKFFERFANIAKDEVYGNVNISDTNWSEFKRNIKTLQQNADKVPKDKFSNITKECVDLYFYKYEEIEKNIIKSGNIFNRLLNIVSPDGFDHYTYKELQYIDMSTSSNIEKYLKEKNECWTDSPCIFIHETKYQDIMKKIYHEKGLRFESDEVIKKRKEKKAFRDFEEKLKKINKK